MGSIQNFYKDVLTAFSYQVNTDGMISFVEPGGGVIPATVDGKRLVLPTKEILRDGIHDDWQAFHPLSENIARKGASPVLGHVQRAAKAILSYYLVELTTRLLEVASDQTLHKSIPPGFGDFLKALSEADKKTLTDFTSLMGKAIAKNKLISLYLKNGGVIAGKKFNRACVIHLPIIDLLKSDEESILGVKLRKRDRKTLLNLFDVVLPHVADGVDTYSVGSNSRVAPYFDAFIRAYAKVATQFNQVIQRFSMLDLKTAEIDLSFMDKIDQMTSFHGKIPNLKGNEGVGEAIDDEEKPTENPVKKLVNNINTDKPRQPVRVQATAPVEDLPPWEEKPTKVQNTGNYGTKGTVSFDEFKRSLTPQQPVMQPTHQPYMNPAYPAQRTAYVHPMYNQPKAVSPFAEALQMNRATGMVSSPYQVSNYQQPVYGQPNNRWGQPQQSFSTLDQYL